MLEIPRAHPDIVELVGRLNYRTSYTQNQWKHAVEAAFLCGMMADELGLDVKLARRAALMHDIGKALTHELDGSHAVIGADYARRLGEAELVANAIGAHHTDEPFNSPYAYLVAAADAMSGAPAGRAPPDGRELRGARSRTSSASPAASAASQRRSPCRAAARSASTSQEDRVDDLGGRESVDARSPRKISREMTVPGADPGHRHPRAQGRGDRQLSHEPRHPSAFFYAVGAVLVIGGAVARRRRWAAAIAGR